MARHLLEIAMIHTNVLPVSTLHRGVSLRTKAVPDVSLFNSALDVLFDYSAVVPLTLDPNVTAEAAEIAMLYSHTNLQLVSDGQSNLVGIISLRDISGDKMLATATAMGVARQDLTVRDLMTPVAHLPYVRHDTLARATVGDLVTILENRQQRYLVVVDHAEQLCGLICANEIARLLGRELNILPVAHHFGEVFSALRVNN